MKILKQGKLPESNPETLFQGTCYYCDTQLECNLTELTEFGNWKYVPCPLCNKNITLIITKPNINKIINNEPNMNKIL